MWHGITLWSVWGSSPEYVSSQPCCSIPNFLIGRVGKESEKTLTLYRRCPATAKTLLCYPHCFNPKGKSPHRLWQRNSAVELHPSQTQLHHCSRKCRLLMIIPMQYCSKSKIPLQFFPISLFSLILKVPLISRAHDSSQLDFEEQTGPTPSKRKDSSVSFKKMGKKK